MSSAEFGAPDALMCAPDLKQSIKNALQFGDIERQLFIGFVRFQLIKMQIGVLHQLPLILIESLTARIAASCHSSSSISKSRSDSTSLISICPCLLTLKERFTMAINLVSEPSDYLVMQASIFSFAAWIRSSKNTVFDHRPNKTILPVKAGHQGDITFSSPVIDAIFGGG